MDSNHNLHADCDAVFSLQEENQEYPTPTVNIGGRAQFISCGNLCIDEY